VKRALLLMLCACTGVIAPGGGGSGGATGGTSGGSDVPTCAQNRNDEVRIALYKACAGCHTSGNFPFFASLDAFESGLVYDARYINPADIEGSLLTKLLEGQAGGSYPQMPPGEKFQAFVDDGRATMTLDALKAWMAALPTAAASAVDAEARVGNGCAAAGRGDGALAARSAGALTGRLRRHLAERLARRGLVRSRRRPVRVADRLGSGRARRVRVGLARVRAVRRARRRDRARVPQARRHALSVGDADAGAGEPGVVQEGDREERQHGRARQT